MSVDPAMMARQQQAAMQSMLAHQRASSGGDEGGGGGGGGGDYGVKFIGPYGINFMQLLDQGWLLQTAGVAGLGATFAGFNMQNTMKGASLPGMGTGLLPIQGNSVFGRAGGGGAMVMG